MKAFKPKSKFDFLLSVTTCDICSKTLDKCRCPNREVTVSTLRDTLNR